jgi:hypothetical protein
VNFFHPALRRYFLEQKAAYLARAKLELQLDELTPEESNCIYEKVLYEPYSKSWYEFHAIKIDEMIEAIATGTEKEANTLSTNRIRLALITLIGYAGQLGRVVEQYYWKFIFEKDAIRGLTIARGANPDNSSSVDILRRL